MSPYACSAGFGPSIGECHVSEDTAHLPSVAQLREIHQALRLFLSEQRLSISYGPIRALEDQYFRHFRRLADALLPVRPLAGLDPSGPDWWCHTVHPALCAIVQHFDATAQLWGWEGLAKADPERSAYLQERLVRFEKIVEQPRFEAAISWRNGDPLNCPRDVRDVAREGIERGFQATLDLESAKDRWESLNRRWWETPRYGEFSPDIGEGCESRGQDFGNGDPIPPVRGFMYVWREQRVPLDRAFVLIGHELERLNREEVEACRSEQPPAANPTEPGSVADDSGTAAPSDSPEGDRTGPPAARPEAAASQDAPGTEGEPRANQAPPPEPPHQSDGIALEQTPSRSRRGRRKGQDKVGEAITRLTTRMKDGLPVNIPSIAKDVRCSPENLRQSPRFMRAYETLIKAFERLPRGRKEDGIVEGEDEGNIR
jgi:hypothetical protein